MFCNFRLVTSGMEPRFGLGPMGISLWSENGLHLYLVSDMGGMSRPFLLVVLVVDANDDELSYSSDCWRFDQHQGVDWR